MQRKVQKLVLLTTAQVDKLKHRIKQFRKFNEKVTAWNSLDIIVTIIFVSKNILKLRSLFEK